MHRERPTIAQVEDSLRTVYDPCSLRTATPLSILDMGLVRDIRIADGGAVSVVMTVTSPGCTLYPAFARAAEEAIGGIPGVSSVEISVRSDLLWSPTLMSGEARRRRDVLDLAKAAVRPQQWREAAGDTKTGSPANG